MSICCCLTQLRLGVLAGMLASGVAFNDSPASEPLATPIDFNRDIRPILSEKCFHCHGPDPNHREAGLRLDQQSAAHEYAIVPGNPEQSEAWLRMTASTPDERMPPPDSNKQLSAKEMKLVRQWISTGGNYAEHWAFVPPKQPSPPDAHDKSWIKNPIDAFILNRLQQAQIEPSPPAAKATLIRRITLDLTGLPPTPAEVAAFKADDSPDAYERVVDRLLASPRYGERMAVPWLDAARYADSHGYQADWERFQWRWRSWVIDAYNRNLPFDEFTIEQLAGDLLPNPTTEQLIATGFNRNHRINDEGGIVPAEYLVEYSIDRVNTTSATWMGLTMECARCHDHKYDPFSQEDFYSLYAFFSSVPELGKDGRKGFAKPFIRVAVRGKQADYEALKQQVRDLTELTKKTIADDLQQELDQAKADLAEAKQRLAEFEKQFVTYAMIMQEMEKPRQTFVLRRGQYNQPGKQVHRAVPANTLGPLPGDAPPNRLGLAQWLVSGKHPLTARVIVNRYWAMLFGTGLVSTIEDFGLQGEYPSHPLLLDWLAAEYPRIGWDTKALLRLMVTSNTYRQSSRSRPELLEIDPNNRLLGRMSRVRLAAEMIRDQALFVSGLLVERIGGPSVKPYQPPGLWAELSFGNKTSIDKYKQDAGDKLYRRSMYTFWKRSVPPPAMEIFDAPARETCTLSRSRTNTPLQALALMNDVTHVEASRVLAERTLQSASAASDAAALVRKLFCTVVAREPQGDELQILCRAFSRSLTKYQANRSAARHLTSHGNRPPADDVDVAKLAALTTTAMTILNLDEAITRE